MGFELLPCWISSLYLAVCSSSVRVLIDGKREEVIRPRVRFEDSEGKQHEVPLETYRVANDSISILERPLRVLTINGTSR